MPGGKASTLGGRQPARGAGRRTGKLSPAVLSRDQLGAGSRWSGRLSAGAGAPEPGAALPGGHIETQRHSGRRGDGMNATVAAQMTGADILKLRKKRGILIWSLVLALGPILIYFIAARIEHAPH